MSEFKEIDRAIKGAVTASLNKAAKSAVSNTSMFIRGTYTIKKTDLDKQTKLTKALKEETEVTLTVSNKALGLFLFRATQSKQGVRATVQKGERKLFRADNPSRGSFIATMKSGHKGVFIRSNEKSLPIKELYGPSAMQLFKSEKVQDYLEETFVDTFDKTLQHELDYRLSKESK